MIPRTRLIIMALLLCHAFVLPGVLTSQLRPSEAQQNQPQAAPSTITVKTDSGQEDTETERLVQQQLQESNDQDSGPPRPAMNVPLGRNEVSDTRRPAGEEPGHLQRARARRHSLWTKHSARRRGQLRLDNRNSERQRARCLRQHGPQRAPGGKQRDLRHQPRHRNLLRRYRLDRCAREEPHHVPYIVHAVFLHRQSR